VLEVVYNIAPSVCNSVTRSRGPLTEGLPRMPLQADRSDRVRVFISATSADLGEHRDAVAEVLLRERILPIDRTNLGDSPGSIVDKLKRRIEECDAAICLVGRCFGAYPPDVGPLPKSYTQIEYEHVHALGMPAYVFMTPDASADEYGSSTSAAAPGQSEPPSDAASAHLEMTTRVDDARFKKLQVEHRDRIRLSGRDVGDISTVADARERILAIVPELKEITRRATAIPGIHLGDPLRTNGHEDLVSGRVMRTDAEGPEVVVRMLKDEATEPVREWFTERGRCWRKLESERVLAALEHSDHGLSSTRPYMVTESESGYESAWDILRNGNLDDREQVIRIARAVADVLEDADRKGVRLLSVSLNDLWLGASGIKLGGLHTCSPAERPTFRDRKSWSDITPEWERMAPELDRPGDRLDATVDLYALGSLLERLQGRPVSAMEALDESDRKDPMRCLAFHCLATDPAVRIQSARQLDALLDDMVERERGEPPVVEVRPGGHASRGEPLLISKYLTTNWEYERFCEATRRERPIHLVARDAGSVRLSGPWLPVVGVNLNDVIEYCRWLTATTGREWRLPTADEWRAAAVAGLEARGLGPVAVYPWGDDDPALAPTEPAARANFLRLFGGTTVVGAFWDGAPDQCLDMGGNVWEWTSSKESHGPRRVLVGGAYDYDKDAMRIESELLELRATRDPHIGFRVVTGGEQ